MAAESPTGLAAREARIAPSILAADFARLGAQVEELAALEDVDRLHVDVMDGLFVPNISFGPLVVEAVRRHTRLPLDVHLMIESPSRYFRQFVEAGAAWLTVHVEACPHLHRDVQAIHELGARAGVALNPGTSPAALAAIVDDVDLVLVMSVNPGFGGQAFIPGALRQIAAVRGLLAERARAAAGGRAVELAVDGGIGVRTAPQARRAGAGVFVAGSSLFGHPAGLAAAVAELRAALASA